MCVGPAKTWRAANGCCPPVGASAEVKRNALQVFWAVMTGVVLAGRTGAAFATTAGHSTRRAASTTSGSCCARAWKARSESDMHE